MKMSKIMAVAVLAVLILSACTPALNWQNHISFRSSGQDLSLSHVGATELVTSCISRNLHYVSIALDTVFFRDLPGMFGADVTFGLEIRGILPNGAPLKTVLDVQRSTGGHAFLSFDNLALLEPFLYTGQNITITLFFKAVGKTLASVIKGRIAGASDLVKKIDPRKSAQVSTAGNLFSSIIGAITGKQEVWKYSFTLYPCDSIMRDKPDMLFTAARHIMMAVPPANAPSKYKQAFKPSQIFKQLKLRGNRLIYRSNGEEYHGSPYIVLNITRYKRYPKTDTPLRKVVTQVDNLIANRNYEVAMTNLYNLRVAINDDKVITEEEKNLERSWSDFREAKIEAAVAAKGKDGPHEVNSMLKQVKQLLRISTQFNHILEPYERKKINFRISRISSKLKDRCEELKLPVPPRLNMMLNVIKHQEKRRLAKKLEEQKLLKQASLRKVDWKRVERIYIGDPTPFYKKWWFWTILGVLAVGGATIGWYAIVKDVEPASLPAQ